MNRWHAHQESAEPMAHRVEVLSPRYELVLLPVLILLVLVAITVLLVPAP